MKPLEIAQNYLARGWAPVPIAYREKGPKIPGWQNLRLTADDLPNFFNGHPANIGVLLGQPSGGLADIDLDCIEAVNLARDLMPETATFGRRGKHRSHLLYVAPGSVMAKFVDPRDRQTLVELRSTGGQTVFPGSTHPSGELVEWEPGTDQPMEISADELRAKVVRLAIASLIQRRAPAALQAYLDTGAVPQDMAAKAAEWSGVSAPPPAQPIIRSPRAAESFSAAAERYNADHHQEWPRSGQGHCPACCCPADGCKCFGHIKESTDRWSCFNTDHPETCGTAGEHCYTGDVLDLDAYLANRTPADHLRAEGYLAAPPPPREEPPPPGDEYAPTSLPLDTLDVGHPLPSVQPILPGVDVTPASAPWPDPDPLDTELLPVLLFTPDLLPEALRPWIMDGANRAQTPLEFVAIPAITALGSLIGRQVALRPLQHDDWQEFANLWGVLVGPPSEMKSHAMSTGIAPLDRLAAQAHEESSAAMDAFVQELAVAKAKQKSIAKALEKATAAGDDTSYLQAQVKPLPEPPNAHRYKVTDATPEKLADLLVKNPNGLLLAVDELAGWLHGLERDGHEQERSFYLTGWSGKSPHDIDRIARGSLHIPAVCLSIIGTIQPGVWSNYVREALGSKAGADGFLQRFQLAVWPDPLKHTHVVDRHPDHAAKARAVEIFGLLSHIDAAQLGAEKGEYDKVPSLRFSEAAQPMAKEWLELHRKRWRSSTDHPAMVAHMIKAQKTWSAICLVCHLVDWVTGQAEDGAGIGLGPLEKAIGWIDYLESHARRIYGCGVEKDRSGLSVMAAKLRAGELPDGFTPREVVKKHWAGLSDPDSLEAVLRHLHAAGWIRPERVRTRGRARIAWRLHPRLAKAAKGGVSGESGTFCTPSAAVAGGEG